MRVLEITSELDGGGVDRLLYNYCSQMKDDIQFDFIVTSKTEGILEQPLKDIGCNIYHIAQIRENFKEHTEQVKKLLEDNHYDIVHDHSGYKAWCNLRVAKKYGVPVRIAHSHTSYTYESFLQKALRKFSTLITKIYATDLFACGNNASKWMWGKQPFRKNVYIMKNAINAVDFEYSQETRNDLRKQLNLTDKFVIGHVGRLSYEKNHEFLIDVFAEVKKIKQNAVLMLIGRGEMQEVIQQKINELNLNDSVLLMGVRNDVPDLLNVMDVFVFPSKFEGLPVTLVEVQANGLPAVISDNVTKEMALSNDFTFLSLNKTASEWANIIVYKSRNESANLIKNTDYDLNVATQKLKSKYFFMCKELENI